MVKNTSSEPGIQALYEETEAYRYQEELHIPAVAEFDQHPHEEVLECGCGLGTDGRQFARGKASYTGCDLSFRSLSLALRGFDIFGLPSAFVCVDAEDLPFPDNKLDVVYSHGVLHHVPNIERTISEVQRTLRSEGKAIIMFYAQESFSYTVGAHTLGRLRLEHFRWQMGRAAFNRCVGLPAEHLGWLPSWVVINNSTDGVRNPLSKIYSRNQLRHIFSAFRHVTFKKHYFPRHKIPLVGPHLPRVVADWLGRTIGAYWYMKAVK